MTRRRLGSSAAVMVTIAAGQLANAQGQVAPMDTADTVYTNGFVYTVDGTESTHQAFAVMDGKFIAVGSNDDMKPFTGTRTRIVDLQGKMVMPGVVDCHIHCLRGALTAYGVSFDAEASLDDIKKAIKDHIAKTKPQKGEWIEGAKFGSALYDTNWAKELDEVAPDNPVYLHDWTNHYLAVSGKALDAAKITKDTPNPSGGEIIRDSSGNATGLLENKAASLVTNVVPKPTDKRMREAAETIFGTLNKFGITSISTAQLDAQRLKTYRAMETDRALTVRIKGHWDWNTRYADTTLDEMAKRFDTREERGPVTDLINADGVKIYCDGVPAYSAPFVDGYADKPTFGTQTIDAPSLNSAMLQFDSLGLQIMMHATGDMSVRHILNGADAIRKRNGYAIRHHLAHATFVQPDDVGRAAPLNVSFEISTWNCYAPDQGSIPWVAAVGHRAVRNNTPIRSLLEAGENVAYGSDWDNVPDPNPFFAMQCMVTRMNPDQPELGSLNPSEAIGIRDAIRVFTANGAYHQMREDTIGSIEPGKWADFIVLNQNLLRTPDREIHNTKVLETVLAGHTVYDAAREGDAR